VSGLASKPLGWFSLVCPQNQWRRFSPVWPQNQWRRFLSVWPQNLLRPFSPVWPQNRWSISWLSLKTKVVEGFPVWASKPARRFLGLGLKTKWASVCRLRHKIDGGRLVRDTCQDLAACLAWKQVWPEDWRRRDDGWCTWHHRGGCVGGKLKMDGSMRRAASDPATLALPFSFY
jgi:hypothetical protein